MFNGRQSVMNLCHRQNESTYIRAVRKALHSLHNVVIVRGRDFSHNLWEYELWCLVQEVWDSSLQCASTMKETQGWVCACMCLHLRTTSFIDIPVIKNTVQYVTSAARDLSVKKSDHQSLLGDHEIAWAHVRCLHHHYTKLPPVWILSVAQEIKQTWHTEPSRSGGFSSSFYVRTLIDILLSLAPYHNLNHPKPFLLTLNVIIT